MAAPQFCGADTEQLREFGERLRTHASALTDLADRLGVQVLAPSIWVGDDGDAVRETWRSTAAPSCVVLHDALVDCGASLDEQAQQQDLASDVGTGGRHGDRSAGARQSPVGEQPRSWWDHLTTATGAYNKVQGLFSKGKKIWDIWHHMRDWRRAADAIMNAEQLDSLFRSATSNMLYDVLDRPQFHDVFSKPGQWLGDVVGKLAGKLGVPTGAGPIKFFGKWVDDLAAGAGNLIRKMPWADDALRAAGKFGDVAAPLLGKVAPALDVGFGLMQMQDSMRSGDAYGAVTGGASALGGGLMLVGGAMSATGIGAVAGGPLMLAGGIISGGAAVADAGRWAVENWDSIVDTATTVAHGAADVVEGAAEGIGNAWETFTGWVSP